MPELPEVQTVIDDLKTLILDKSIEKIEIYDKKLFSPELQKNLLNQKILSISRLGKYIIFHFQNCELIIHLRMTGQFFYVTDNQAFSKSKHDRMAFLFNEGILVFRDVRRFGTINLVKSHLDLLQKLGLDPLGADFNEAYLKQRLLKNHKNIKSFLLDQTQIAGLGNIYADEALFEAKIHPESNCDCIPDDRVMPLVDAIKKVLKKGLEAKGTSLGEGLGNYKHVNGQGKNQMQLMVYGASETPCKTCGFLLIKKTVASRGTTFCLKCQVLHKA